MRMPVCVYAMITLLLCVSLLLPVECRAGLATEVTINKSVLLNLQNSSERVSIANPSIAELVVISPAQLQINGKKVGSTSLIVWEKGGKTSFFDIRVKGDISQLEDQIRDLAPNDSITVTYANDTIVLAGKAANDQTIRNVVEIAQAYAIKETGNAGGKDNECEVDKEPVRINPKDYDGIESAEKEKKKSNEPKWKLLNHIQVDNPQQVLLEVKVAQVDRTALKSLGISMLVKGSSGEGFSNLVGAPEGPNIKNQFDVKNDPPGIAGNMPWIGAIAPLAPYQLGGSLYKTGLGGVLKALASKDLAKILAEPNLLVKSGEVGKFLAGSKFPVAVVTGIGAVAGTEIRYEDVGVKLVFKPVVLENGLISLKVAPAEFSNIQGFLPVNGYPIIDTREIKTSVQLRRGESLVLGGLLQQDTIKNISKIPVLGDIPLLGALFRSTQDDLREKELVFFITPHIVTANPAGNESELLKPFPPGIEPELPTDQQLTPQQEKEFRWIPTGE